MTDCHSLIESARRTLALETRAVAALADRLDAQFAAACERILQCTGRVIVSGMGKSGHIGRKIAATLASTGTPAFFVHPAEAGHGDVGMITRDDLVIAISNSGSTSELLTLLPVIKRLGIPLISMSGRQDSPLARAADFCLDVGVESEACPLDLAPTSSTTAALAMGDALAVALLEARGFTADDFAFSHPGGALGRRLLLKVSDIMHQGAELPSVPESTPLKLALLEMTEKGFGLTTVHDTAGALSGVFTDGDLRRCIERGVDLDKVEIGDVMTRKPRTVASDILAAEALRIMEEARITAVVVENSTHHALGVLHMHDLLRAGVV